jgi:hypothetical protein
MEQINRNTKELVLKWLSVAIVMLCFSGVGSSLSWLIEYKFYGKLSPILVPFYALNFILGIVQIRASWNPETISAPKFWASFVATFLGWVMLFVDAVLVPGAVHYDGAWQLIVLIPLQGVWAMYAKNLFSATESLPTSIAAINPPFHTPVVLLSQIILGLTASGVVLAIATPVGMAFVGLATVPVMGIIYILTTVPATIALFIFCKKTKSPGQLPIHPALAVLLSIYCFALAITSAIPYYNLIQNLYFTVGTWVLQSIILITWTIFLFLQKKGFRSQSDYGVLLSLPSDFELEEEKTPEAPFFDNAPNSPDDTITSQQPQQQLEEPTELSEEIRYAAKVTSWASLPFTVAALGGGIAEWVLQYGGPGNIIACAMLLQTGFNIYELVLFSNNRNLKKLTSVSCGSFMVAIISGLACYSPIINRCMYSYVAGGIVGILASMRLASAVLILTYPNRSLKEGIWYCGTQRVSHL